MKKGSRSGEFERAPRPQIVAPFSERMLHADNCPDWLHEFARQQLFTHKQQVARVDAVINILPHHTIDLKLAYESHSVPTDELAAFYATLTDLVSAEDTRRVLLYLPFEWLPAPDWFHDDAQLAQVADEFRGAYADAWWELLRHEEVRANYTDGDVADLDRVDPDDLPRVIKAAHLLPWLIERGIVPCDDALRIRQGTDSPVLVRSIDEGLAAADMMQQTVLPQANELPRVEQLRSLYESRLDRVCDSTDTPNRRKWLARKVADELVSELAATMTNHGLDDEYLAALLQSQDTLLLEVAVESIGRAFQVADDAHGLYANCVRQLERAIIAGGAPVYERVASVLRRAVANGRLSPVVLADHGIHSSTMRGEQSANLLHRPEMDDMYNLCKQIRTDETLSTLVYPMVLVGGSLLKGYGTESSDLDTTILVRPGVDEVKRTVLHQRLQELSPGYDFTELWLEQDQEQLRVRNFATTDPHVGDAWWTHVLFGAVWVGDVAEIDTLQSQVLPNYFAQASPGPYGQFSRRIYLERMEQDALQYRLLHRGYARHFPIIDTQPGTEPIDGESVFYDPGYRLLATRLFLEKVWLPKQ